MNEDNDGVVQTQAPPPRSARATVLVRQSAVERPLLSDAIRRTNLGLKDREVRGKLLFRVQDRLDLPYTATSDEASAKKVAAIRRALGRRLEHIHETRQEDDASYHSLIESRSSVALVTALPPSHESGGWRCHAFLPESLEEGGSVCLQANSPSTRECTRCKSPKPNLRPQFAYLRHISYCVRRRRREYTHRIIAECDDELERCESADREARALLGNSTVDQEDDEFLMMDVDCIQRGVWQRVNARDLLPLLSSRQDELKHRLSTARGELAIMIQASYELAVVHAQRVVRRFLARARLPMIRQQVEDESRCRAAIEIQRIARSGLARRSTDRLRLARKNAMATVMQSYVRRIFAEKERRKRWARHLQILRNDSATEIQRVYRGHMCKVQAQVLTEEKRQRLEAEEKAKIKTRKHDCAVVIQKHARRIQARTSCRDKRIEMRLHERLLMYTERYTVDGDFHAFVKSISDDYHRFERTIQATIIREQNLATSFVDKVVAARDRDHQNAWKNYLSHTQQNVPPDNNHRQAGPKSHWNKTYKLYQSKPRISTKKAPKMTKPASGSDFFLLPSEIEAPPRQSSRESCASDHSVVGEEPQRRQEAMRLLQLSKAKDRLRGLYLRFDVPSGLDDTVSRFILAVSLRYDFEDPGESSVHGNFIGKKSAPDQEKQLVARTFAERLVHSLHSMSIVFIRDLLPRERMYSILSSMDVSDEFVVLAFSLLSVLENMSKGNFMQRKILQTKCRQLLETQKTLGASCGVSNNFLTEDDNIVLATSLAECGNASLDDMGDEDSPGGLWRQPVADQAPSSTKNVIPPSNILGSGTKKTRSWAVAYSAKIISENKRAHPALSNFIDGRLISEGQKENE